MVARSKNNRFRCEGLRCPVEYVVLSEVHYEHWKVRTQVALMVSFGLLDSKLEDISSSLGLLTFLDFVIV